MIIKNLQKNVVTKSLALLITTSLAFMSQQARADVIGTSVEITNHGSGAPTSSYSINAGSVAGAIIVGESDARVMNNPDGLIVGRISSTSGNLQVTNSVGAIVGNISTSTGDLDLISSGSIAGNITLGSNGGSTIMLNDGSITGNIKMNNVLQTMTFSGGVLAGNVDGAGNLVINTPSSILSGNIGSVTQVTAMTINGGNTLNTSTFNVNVGVTSLNAGSTLILNSGTLIGVVQGVGSNAGAVLVEQNFSSQGEIGTLANSLDTVSIASGKTLNMSVYDNAIAARAISLGDNSALTMGSKGLLGAVSIGNGAILTLGNNSFVSGAINGAASGVGTLAIGSYLFLVREWLVAKFKVLQMEMEPFLLRKIITLMAILAKWEMSCR